MVRLIVFAFLFVGGVVLGVILILFFFSSSSSILAPSVVGKSVEEAEIIAKTNSLKIKIQEERFDTKKDKGIILRQNPNAGMSVKKGQTIYVIVSKGLERVILPDLKGQTLRTAQISLSQEGLRLKGISYISSKEDPETVIGQNPSYSAIVPKESDCYILVSQGGKRPLFVMPDLNGKEAKIATRILAEYGIQCYVENSVSGEGKIIRQKPLPGFPIDSSETVFLGVEK
ncbi:MAG: PASTA domain-containing protein [Acidobacteria bacterium]|nr:PASTA domain-containing protein [Acidobacteriota bacterium]